MSNFQQGLCRFGIFFVLFIQITAVISGKTAYFVDGHCKFNRKYFSNLTLTIANKTLSTNMNIIKRIDPGFTAMIEIQLRLDNSQNYQTLFKYDLDVCRAVIAFKDNLFKKWFKSILKYGNFVENCPVNVGNYYLNNWIIEPNMIPSYLFPGDYRVHANGFYGTYKGGDFVVDALVKIKIDTN